MSQRDLVSRVLEEISAPPDERSRSSTAPDQARDVVDVALEAVAGDPGSRRYQVAIIRPGKSRNGRDYPADVLEAAAARYDGAPAFADHPTALDQTRAGGRSVRDLVGVYESARWDPARGVVATLALIPGTDWLSRTLDAYLDAKQSGRTPPPVGISADQLIRHTPAGLVTEIVRVNSADVVIRPAAGGEVLAVHEATPPTSSTSSAPAETERWRSAEAERQRSADLVEVRRQAWEALVEAKLLASRLPDPARAFVRAQFLARVMESAQLDDAIAQLAGVLGQATARSAITGAGVARAHLRTAGDRLKLAVEALMGLPLAESDRDVPRLSGIREAYLQITGDYAFTGRPDPARSVLEANETTTSVLNDALLSALNKRIVADYRTQPRWWEPIVSRVPLSDMRLQTRVLMSDFASLASVGENGAYQNIAWGDTKETYTPGKRGNLVYVTLETIINDDLRSVQRIPAKIAVAAAATLNETISALFTTSSGAGPAMSDGYSVFDATNHGANAGTAALASTTLQTAMIAISKQTNSASKRIGLVGRYLLVPPDLQFTAAVLAQSALLPGGNNNDINPIAGKVTPIVVPNFTDVNNWYLLAAREQIESIEVGFLNGREEPELLLQDDPTDGTVFTNDAITWKVRHIYGAGWLDYRGAFGAVVTG